MKKKNRDNMQFKGHNLKKKNLLLIYIRKIINKSKLTQLISNC